MSLLKYLDEPMVVDEDEDNLWEQWREMARNGIVSYADYDIRNLHAQFVTMLADAELKYANFDGQKEAKKLERELKEASLLAVHYPDGALNARTAQVKADERYQKIANQAKEFELDRASWKGRCAACGKVVECLSREISYRIKK